jgi:P2 family phage contractile tail tube protein
MPARSSFAAHSAKEGTGTTRAAEITMRGRPTEFDFGTAKKASETAHKSKYRLSYYRLEVDGGEWIEIDIMANVFRVFGVDRTSDIRAALGD